MTSQSARFTATLVAAAALAVLSGQASADPTHPTRSLEPSVTVHLADLNLANPEGARAAYGRIRSAAQQVCGTSFSIWDANRWSSWRECYRTTIEATVNRVDSPTLSALHRSTTKPRVDLRGLSAGTIPR